MEEVSVESQPKEIKYITQYLEEFATCIVLLWKITREILLVNAIPFHLGANDNNASENHRLCPL